MAGPCEFTDSLFYLFRPVFSMDQEKELTEFLKMMERRFFGLTIMDFRRLAYQYAERNGIPHSFNKNTEMAGEGFIRNFLKRNPSLSIRTPEATSAARAAGFNKVVVSDFFTLLDELLKDKKFPASRIYNCDETGVTTVPNKQSRIISTKGKKQVGSLTSAERGTLITAEICCNAIGNFVPPMLIFPRVRRNPLFEVGVPPESLITCHPSGWMQTDIFIQWFEHFIHHTKPTETDPVLLIMDGHATHTKNINLIEMARANFVSILILPPHTSHRMQPLDVAFMGPFSTFYEQEVRSWLRNHPGRVVTIQQVGALFGKAYNKAATTSNAVSGFAKSGISPFDPNVFSDDCFDAATTTERPAPASDASEAAPSVPSPSPSVNVLHTEDAPLSPIEMFVEADAAEVTREGIASEADGTAADVTTIFITPSKPSSSTGHELAAKETSSATSSAGVTSVSPADIIALPAVDNKPRKSGIKRGKTVILTSSPCLKDLQNDHESRVGLAKRPKQAKGPRTRLLFPDKNTSRKKTPRKKKKVAKKQAVKEKEHEEDVECIYCSGKFSESR